MQALLLIPTSAAHCDLLAGEFTLSIFHQQTAGTDPGALPTMNRTTPFLHQLPHRRERLLNLAAVRGSIEQSDAAEAVAPAMEADLRADASEMLAAEAADDRALA